MALPPCMGVTMNKWGPCAWNTLHAFAHTSPMVLDSARRADFKKLLYLYSSFLPCPKCRLHFVNYLDSHLTDRSLITRESCILFLHEAHNDVNREAGQAGVVAGGAHGRVLAPAAKGRGADAVVASHRRGGGHLRPPDAPRSENKIETVDDNHQPPDTLLATATCQDPPALGSCRALHVWPPWWTSRTWTTSTTDCPAAPPPHCRSLPPFDPRRTSACRCLAASSWGGTAPCSSSTRCWPSSPCTLGTAT